MIKNENVIIGIVISTFIILGIGIYYYFVVYNSTNLIQDDELINMYELDYDDENDENDVDDYGDEVIVNTGLYDSIYKKKIDKLEEDDNYDDDYNDYNDDEVIVNTGLYDTRYNTQQRYLNSLFYKEKIDKLEKDAELDEVDINFLKNEAKKADVEKQQIENKLTKVNDRNKCLNSIPKCKVHGLRCRQKFPKMCNKQKNEAKKAAVEKQQIENKLNKVNDRNKCLNSIPKCKVQGLRCRQKFPKMCKK
jgi:hypothetical protein